MILLSPLIFVLPAEVFLITRQRGEHETSTGKDDRMADIRRVTITDAAD